MPVLVIQSRACGVIGESRLRILDLNKECIWYLSNSGILSDF